MTPSAADSVFPQIYDRTVCPAQWRDLSWKLRLDFDQDMFLGIDSIDADHVALIQHFNLLVDALCGQQGSRMLRDMFTGLITEAEKHFQREELLMREINYPRFYSHRASHRKLIRDAEDFIYNLKYVFDEKGVSLVLLYFRYWLTKHIRTEDRDLWIFTSDNTGENQIYS